MIKSMMKMLTIQCKADEENVRKENALEREDRCANEDRTILQSILKSLNSLLMCQSTLCDWVGALPVIGE